MITNLDYEQIVEHMLRNVVREVLLITKEQGLPGEHHFYISFLTRHKDVELPDILLKTYPHEMPVVLQNQFYDLTVSEKDFSVVLSFNNVDHKIRVPFDAVTSFSDPHAKFGLKFEEKEDIEDVEEEPPVQDIHQEQGESNVVTLDAFRKK